MLVEQFFGRLTLQSVFSYSIHDTKTILTFKNLHCSGIKGAFLRAYYANELVQSRKPNICVELLALIQGDSSGKNCSRMQTKITYHAQVMTKFRIELHVKDFNQIQLKVEAQPRKICQR